MKMIVGLGNPGTKYAQTKHNIGFMVVDRMAEKQQAVFKKNTFEAEVAEFFYLGEKILLVKPQTFMNESGRAVGPLMTYFGIYPEELVVVYDDLDLVTGKIRLRQKGSAGGHNGIKSIISHLNTNVFDRIKVGIGRPEGNKTVVQHVLSPFSKEVQPLIEASIDQSVAALEFMLDGHSFIDTMNKFN
ncbi:aminoacyl-tRNA hydrolase [Enterococcus hirae]|uniref:aminoacyl-tRNA hydrolase n=1 Tax=Enterococcus hirae TaxID=1354 RepID=UPI0013637661|nr:aminoacyl-tRNA hydrolase [Enterococcus hirae]EMF0049222.1 aminoacyl-tRNA hydrolase [Enterococcus hirae]EMF0066739.1 aminoacyl-tRNA hydrolase [Enterococcus hirae]EMF0107477.1 aminoacyl-tRNA hydrolase [Enterococcus hirae]EMF0117155.1 aminoacyl-tRNA hydrolase [Enterococcus hirae]EMF0122835.1 aminoacyl-tRNA hydrolase [Enterococcus hirae]